MNIKYIVILLIKLEVWIISYVVIGDKYHISSMLSQVLLGGFPTIRAGEPANFFIGSGSWLFVQAAPAPVPRSQKHPAPDYWLSLAKYSFPRKLVR